MATLSRLLGCTKVWTCVRTSEVRNVQIQSLVDSQTGRFPRLPHPVRVASLRYVHRGLERESSRRCPRSDGYLDPPFSDDHLEHNPAAADQRLELSYPLSQNAGSVRLLLRFRPFCNVCLARSIFRL